MLGSGRGSLELEEGLRGAVLDGAARGLSEVLSELDGELTTPACEGCGSRMHRWSTRSLQAVPRRRRSLHLASNPALRADAPNPLENRHLRTGTS